MAGLEIQFKPIEQVPGGGVVELAGAIDTKTIAEFQKTLDSIQQKGVQKLVLDFSKVKYVNSTGLGALVKYADTFRQVGGGVALMKVPAKVKIVIEMLGLNAFFEICNNLNEALEALNRGGKQGGVVVSPPKKKEAPKAPPRARSSGRVTSLQTTPVPSQAPAPSAPAQSPSPEAAPAQALVVNCQSCQLPLELPSVGNFQCPRCFTIVSRSPNNEVTFQMPHKTPPITMALNCTPMCTEGFRYFLVAFGKKMGLSESVTQGLDQVARELAQVMTQYVYEGSQKDFYHVYLSASNGKLKIRISDYGKVIPPDKIPSLFRRTKEVMKEFRCDPHPRGGNLIHMEC